MYISVHVFKRKKVSVELIPEYIYQKNYFLIILKNAHQVIAPNYNLAS